MKSFYCLVIGSLIIACSPSSNYRYKLEQIESVIEVNPDSAKALLEAIPSALLHEGEEKALYNLLWTMAEYKLYKPFTDDSLIRYSAEYYEKSKDTNRLATAYYYIGAVNYDELKNKDKAVGYLKKAEELMSDDELLKNKLYELLHSINYNACNYKQSLQYANLFLNSSKRINDPELISRAYEHLSNDYISIGDEGKAAEYIRQSLTYSDQCSKKRRAYIFGNYANFLIGIKRFNEAKSYLEKALRLHPMPNHFIMLGKISKQVGDTIQARRYLEKAATFDNPRFTIKACKLLAEMQSEQGNHRLAFRMLAKADSLKDAYREQMRTAQLAEIQHRYDAVVMEKALTERKNFWLTFAIAILAVLLLALLALVYYFRKAKKYKGIIDENIEQIFRAEQEIELLKSAGIDAEHELLLQKEEIERLKEASAQKLGRGKEIYETIMNGGTVANFTKAIEQDFVDYYAFTFSKQFHALILPYKGLTLRKTSYLVLRQSGMSDKAPQGALECLRLYHQELPLPSEGE